MHAKRSIAALLLCAMVLLMILVVVDDCSAQGEHSQEILEKKGIEGIFAGKGAKDPRSPKSWQKWLGISSIFVMIGVVKWL
jgi:hypothetical protein